jgi:hypothetical protein
VGKIRTSTILSGATATGAGDSVVSEGSSVFHAAGTTSSGAGSATILIQGSNDPTNADWVTLATIGITLATTIATGVSDGAPISKDAPWAYVRAYVSAISGTGAAVSVYRSIYDEET